MKTDPRNACANVEERMFWAVVHDLVAHPFMAVTGYSKASLRFHDWTSYRAWPRVGIKPGRVALFETTRFGTLQVRSLTPGVYSVQHGLFSHTLNVTATDAIDAVEQAEAWFSTYDKSLMHSAEENQ